MTTAEIHEVLSRVLRVFVEVEDVTDGELSCGEHHVIGGVGCGEFVEIRIDFLNFAAKIDRLLEERALDAREGVARAFARIVVHKTRDAVEVA